MTHEAKYTSQGVYMETTLTRRPSDRIADLEAEIARLNALINAPIVDTFLEGVRLEAAHQQERWGIDHDEGKSHEEWMWLVAYLCTKATQAARYGDAEKHKHHIVTAGAALLNWHRHATGDLTAMRPGVAAPKGFAETTVATE